MSAVRFLIGLTLGLSSLAVASAASAQGTLPAMSGVTEIILQPARVANREHAEKCGLSDTLIADTLLKLLKADALPVYTLMDRQERDPRIARIDLLPEISTLLLHNVDCVTFVTLSAQSKQPMRIPPIERARNVQTVYWRNGVMFNSTQISHAEITGNALQKLAAQFSRQYRLDQPPKLPDFAAPTSPAAPPGPTN